MAKRVSVTRKKTQHRQPQHNGLASAPLRWQRYLTERIHWRNQKCYIDEMSLSYTVERQQQLFKDVLAYQQLPWYRRFWTWLSDRHQAVSKQRILTYWAVSALLQKETAFSAQGACGSMAFTYVKKTSKIITA